MAPEQARGEEVDARADVFALGAMLYHLLAGEMPHAGASSVDELLERVRQGPPRSLRAIDPELPLDLCAIAEKAMSHELGARYATAKELADDLHRFQTGQLVRARDYATHQLIGRWIRRHRALVALGAAALTVLGVVAVYSVQRVRRERDTANLERAATQRALDAEQRATRASARSMASLHQELGRQELERGNDQRALVHLLESARQAEAVGPGLAHLLGRASASFDAFRWTARAGGKSPAAAAVSRDGRVLSIVFMSGRLERRDAATGELIAGLDTGQETITSGDISPDGRWIAAAGGDLVMWDAGGTGQVFRVPGSDTQHFIGVAISPRGLVATGDLQGHLGLTSLGATALTRRWAAHTDGVSTLIWRGDGGAFISKVKDGVALAWDTQGAPVATLAGGSGAHEKPALDRAGTRVALIDRTAFAAVVYRTDTFAPVARLAPGPALLREGSFLSDIWLSPDGARALTMTSDRQPILWDVARGAVMAELPGHATGVAAAAFVDEGRAVVTADARAVVRVWDAATGALTHTLAMHPGLSYLVAAAPTGRRIVVAHEDGLLEAWDLAADASRRALVGHLAQARRVVYSPDGARAVTASHDATVRVWDVSTGREILRIAHPGGRAASIEVSRDGAALLTAGVDGTARVWDAATGALRTSFVDGHELAIARFLPGGGVVTAGEAGVVRVWRPDGSLVCATPELGAPFFGLALTRDGATLFAYAEAPLSLLIASSDCGVVHEVETGQRRTLNATFSADGTKLAVGGHAPFGLGHSLLLVDVASGAIRPVETPNDEMTVPVAIDPSGELLAAGGQTGAIRLWSTRTLEEVALLDGASSMAGYLLFTQDGLLVAGFDDGAIRIWEVASARQLSTLRGHTGGVYWLQLRPDGRQLASAALDAVPRLWSLPRPAASIDELSRLARCLVPFRLEGGMPAPAEPEACPPDQRRKR